MAPENILGNVFFPLKQEKQKEGHEAVLFFNTDSVLEIKNNLTTISHGSIKSFFQLKLKNSLETHLSFLLHHIIC